MSLLDDLTVSESDILIGNAAVPADAKDTITAAATAASDPVTEIQNKVAPRVAEARLIKVVDQAGLIAVSDRRAIIGALKKEAIAVFKPIKQKMDEAKAEVLKQERAVLDPLQEEDRLLESISTSYVVEQRRVAEENARKEREIREAEERLLLAEAAERQRVAQERINAELQAEYAEGVEQQVKQAEAAGAPVEVIESICNTPAPEPVMIPLDIPVMLPVVASAPAVQMPKGMALVTTYDAEVISIPQLCRAIADGKVPSNYVEANTKALRSRAVADKDGFNIPGCKLIKKQSTSQRSR